MSLSSCPCSCPKLPDFLTGLLWLRSRQEHSSDYNRLKGRHLFQRTRKEGDAHGSLEGPAGKESVGMEDRRNGLRFWSSYGYSAWPSPPPTPVSFPNLCFYFLVFTWGSPAAGRELVMLSNEKRCFDLGLPGSKHSSREVIRMWPRGRWHYCIFWRGHFSNVSLPELWVSIRYN